MKAIHHLVVLAVGILGIQSASGIDRNSAIKDIKFPMNAEQLAEWAAAEKLEIATFGSGCFWCTEAVFQRMIGVEKVVSGYAGGHVVNPTYEQVCNKRTGHAEVCQIFYDPSKVTFAELLEVFWKTHDPTTKNQQGNDIGPQYRSVIFYHNDSQKAEAEKYRKKLDEAGAFPKKIVTEIDPYTNFYPAEAYHQNYYNNNPFQGYCQAIVKLKVEKFKSAFADKLKPEAK